MKHSFFLSGTAFLLALLSPPSAFACQAQSGEFTYDCALRVQTEGNPFFRVTFEVKIPPAGTRCGGPKATVVSSDIPAALNVGFTHRFPSHTQFYDNFTIERTGRRPVDCYRVGGKTSGR